MKLEAGAPEAIPVVAIAVLQRLGLLNADLPPGLQPFARLPLRNWAGREVGEIRAEPGAHRDDRRRRFASLALTFWSGGRYC